MPGSACEHMGKNGPVLLHAVASQPSSIPEKMPMGGGTGPLPNTKAQEEKGEEVLVGGDQRSALHSELSVLAHHCPHPGPPAANKGAAAPSSLPGSTWDTWQ